MLEDKLNQDLKQAMLARDSFVTNSLRTLKSAILYSKVAQGTRDQAMADSEVVGILQKEAKKRQESADLYRKGGSDERAEQELAEKALIERYLPAQLTDAQIATFVEVAIADLGGPDMVALGPIIQKVREQTAGKADGVRIARIVKEKLQR